MSEIVAGQKKDFWGEPFVIAGSESSVVLVFKEQADALTRRTDSRIIGEVVEQIDAPGRTRWVSLYGRVPGLDDYRDKLISIVHPFTSRDKPEFPLFAHAEVDDAKPEEIQDLKNLEELEEWMKRVLSSREMHEHINFILGQLQRQHSNS